MFGTVLTCFISLTSYAGLAWENVVSKEDLGVRDEVAIAQFAFKNTGPGYVVIDEIRTSCGCTTAELEKMEYAPGESGTIEAVFNVGNRHGFQRKKIFVYFAGDKKPIELTMEVNIPTVFVVNPSIVYWKKGDAAAPQTIKLINEQKDAINITSIKYNSDYFDCVLEPVEVGRKYQIHVRPLSTNLKIRANIEINTDWPKDKPVSYTITAYVK